MKRICIWSSLFLSLSSGIYAQESVQFAPLGAEWWYSGEWAEEEDSSPDDPYIINKITHYKSVEATVYNDQTCRRIEVTNYSLVNGSSSYSSGTGESLYVYDNMDTVFYFSQLHEKFVPMYIFSESSGLLTFPTTEDLPTSSGTFTVSIDSVFTSNVGGVDLKTVAVSLTDEDSPIGFAVNGNFRGNASTAGLYLERIGAPNSGFIPPTFTGFTIPEVHTPYLLCYSDGDLSYTINDLPCAYPDITSVDDIEASAPEISIYPNPADDIITVESERAFPKNAFVALTSMDGRLIRQYDLPANGNRMTCPLHNIAPGVYLLKFDMEGRAYFKRIVLR